MPSQIEITDLEIALSIAKLEGDMVVSLHKATKKDRVGNWEEAIDCLDEALASLRAIGVLESNCPSAYKEAECGLDDMLSGEFESDEFAVQEFTQQIFRRICQ